MQPQTPTERRSGARDRRAPGPPVAHAGPERRAGQRRQLPRSRWQQWPSLLASAALGVTTAVLLQSFVAEAPPRVWAAELVQRVPPSPGPQQLPRFSAAEAAALRDEAEALTAAAVALDEQASLRWRPLRGELAAALVDPVTPELVRSDLHATTAALERLGL
jgi:hypothetical protein